MIGLDTGHLGNPRWLMVARWLNRQHGAHTCFPKHPLKEVKVFPFYKDSTRTRFLKGGRDHPLCRVCLSSVCLCYMSNYKPTGTGYSLLQRLGYPSTRQGRTNARQEPGESLPTWPEASCLPAVGFSTYVSRLLPRQRAGSKLTVGS